MQKSAAEDIEERELARWEMRFEVVRESNVVEVKVAGMGRSIVVTTGSGDGAAGASRGRRPIVDGAGLLIDFQ
jgi:hypothetical protein